MAIPISDITLLWCILCYYHYSNQQYHYGNQLTLLVTNWLEICHYGNQLTPLVQSGWKYYQYGNQLALSVMSSGRHYRRNNGNQIRYYHVASIYIDALCLHIPKHGASRRRLSSTSDPVMDVVMVRKCMVYTCCYRIMILVVG